MRYFLDFDRTVFDTDAFKVYLAERERDTTITGEPEEDVARSLNALVMSGTLAFAPMELGRFIYNDAREFLLAHLDTARIITFGNVAFQKIKVESAIAEAAPYALYTGELLKAEYLAAWDGYAGEEAVFVDDRSHELAPMSERFPALQCYEIRRDGKEGDGRWPVIRSLSELPLA